MKKTLLFFTICMSLLCGFTSCSDDNDGWDTDPWHCYLNSKYTTFYCESWNGEWGTGYLFPSTGPITYVRIPIESLPEDYVELNSLVPIKINRFRATDGVPSTNDIYQDLGVEPIVGEEIEKGWTINACQETYQGDFVLGDNKQVIVELTDIPESDEFFVNHTKICFHISDYPGIEQLNTNQISFKIVKYLWTASFANAKKLICVVSPI